MIRSKEVIQRELDGVGNHSGEIHLEMNMERKGLSSMMRGVFLYVSSPG